jgi:hypothetical protein
LVDGLFSLFLRREIKGMKVFGRVGRGVVEVSVALLMFSVDGVNI